MRLKHISGWGWGESRTGWGVGEGFRGVRGVRDRLGVQGGVSPGWEFRGVRSRLGGSWGVGVRPWRFRGSKKLIL